MKPWVVRGIAVATGESNQKTMKVPFTILKKCLALLFVAGGLAQTSHAQIVKNLPTKATVSTGGCNRCGAEATVSDLEYSLTADTTSFAEISTRRSGGITGQKWAEIAYDITPSPDNRNVYVRLTASDNTAEPAPRLGAANSSEGGTTLNLYYQGTQVPASAVKMMEFRDRYNNTWYRLTTANDFDQLVVRVTSKNYDYNYSWHVRSAKIYSVHTTQGSATLDDCGEPAMIAFDSEVNGVPLAGPTTARLWEAIDGDFSTNTSGVLAGLANIGAPTWNYHVMFNGLSGGTSTLKLTIGRGATIVNLSGIRYRVHFLRNGEIFQSSDWTTLQILGLLAINSYKPLTFYHDATAPFDEARIEVQVPGISVTGEMIRVYDIRRTVPAPTLYGALNSTLEVYKGENALLTATGAATDYLWYQGVKFTDPDTQQSGYIIDEETGLLGITQGTPTETPLKTITNFTYGPVSQDSVVFVRSIRSGCPTDTSAAHAINIRAITKPLPVTLSKLTVTRSGAAALLQWATTEETDNHYFDIQRSTDGENWTILGRVYSQQINGTGKGLSNYEFTDKNPANGVNYYQLLQVDTDGSLNKTGIVSIYMDALTDLQSYVYPNPANNYFKVAVSAGSEVVIYDMTGREIGRKVATSDAQDLSFDAGMLPTGLYLIQVSKDGFVSKHLLRIEK